MSTKATITRTLIIESPQRLYDILNYHKELMNESIDLKIFMDQMNLTIEGCQCDFLESIAEVMSIYVDLSHCDDSAKKKMKQLLNCDKIIFKSKDQILFEF